jgi:hypothetical protein
MSLFADAVVRSRWFFVDDGYFARHPERRYRLRGLYPMESVQLDQLHREVPPKGSPVLKIVKRVAPGWHEMQAVRFHDKAAVIAALDSDAAVCAAFDLLDVADVVDVRETKALAQARETGPLR